MTQQTAIDYLVNYMLENFHLTDESLEIFEQAKQMEREQIINAWRNGDNDSMYSPDQLDEQAEEYYNQTYKNK